jgi:hypothetical protein
MQFKEYINITYSMDIHENDIGKEKRVFLVTLPKNNIENMQICVGDGYEDDDKLRYNIYKVDKKSNKVSSTIGYYEFPKDKDDLYDEHKDFKVLDLGEDAMHLQTVVKADKKEKDKEKEKKGKPEKYMEDVEFIIHDYFDGNYDLRDEEIIPTFLTNLVKPYVWTNNMVIEAVASFYNIYVILVDDDILDHNPNRVAVYPLLNGEYEPKPYVIISFQTRDHYQLIVDGSFKNNKFKLEDLPEFLINKMPKEHTKHLSEKAKDDKPKYEKIVTTTNGDCYWDSVNRAITNKNSYDTETVIKMRKTVAGYIESNPDKYSAHVNEGIVLAYHLYTTKNNDSVYKLVFPKPTVKNRTEFDDAFEHLFMKENKVSKKFLHDSRSLSDAEQARLVTEYLQQGQPEEKEKEKEEEKEELPAIEVEDLEPEPEPVPKVVIKKAKTKAKAKEPEPEPFVENVDEPDVNVDSGPDVPDVVPNVAPVKSDDERTAELNKETVVTLKEMLKKIGVSAPSTKAEIIKCIINPGSCKQTKRKGGRASNKYTRRL